MILKTVRFNTELDSGTVMAIAPTLTANIRSGSAVVYRKDVKHGHAGIH